MMLVFAFYDAIVSECYGPLPDLKMDGEPKLTSGQPISSRRMARVEGGNPDLRIDVILTRVVRIVSSRP